LKPACYGDRLCLWKVTQLSEPDPKQAGSGFFLALAPNFAPGQALFYIKRMDIPITWGDLVLLAAKGKVEKDGNILSVSRPILPDLQISADGLPGFVRFTVDKSDPLNASKVCTHAGVP
jgi:hypothetical protein